jgi:regulator of sigma E protease
MGFLTDTFYLLIVISILVVIHEFGHFIAARLSGMRAEIFSVGMGPRLLGWNKISGFKFGNLAKDWDGQGHTDYRLSLLPIGGFVKISGMIDESMDTAFIQKEPQPWEFRSKSALKKAFVISAGVIMNTLLAIFFFSLITYFEGKTLKLSNTIGYVEKDSPASVIGFKGGDKIKSINGKKPGDWDNVFQLIVESSLGNSKNISIIRNGADTVLTIDGQKFVKALSSAKSFGAYPEGMRVIILGVEKLKPAGKAGLQDGDTVNSINGQQIVSVDEFIDMVKSHSNMPLLLTWSRKGKIISDSITPDKGGKIGVQITEIYSGPKAHESFNIFESAKIGTEETYNSILLIGGTFYEIIRGKISIKQSIGGPIQIAKRATQSAEMGLAVFINFMAILSISLAVINILPFPALDGGHLVFIIIEGIIRREVSPKVKIAFQQTGIIVLLLFMAFVIYNDITRL